MNVSSQRIQKTTRELLHANRRYENGFQYTLPSPDLYPFQWLWDSCFHAIIFSCLHEVEDAKAELRSALSHQLPSGLLPHIIYWKMQKENNGNWGRELRGDIINAAWGTKDTSAVTQPPIVAQAVYRVYEMDGDTNFLQEVYPSLRAYYHHLKNERSLQDDGLLFIINPDESGEDNSPRFDRAQGLAIHHTADENLDKRIELMRENVVCNFEAKQCMHQHFSIVDVSFNIIYAEGLACMHNIAKAIAHTEDAEQFKMWEEETKHEIQHRLCTNGVCYSFDLKLDKPIKIDTWNLFMPLYGGLLTQQEADALIHNVLLDEEKFWTPYPVPSVSKSDRSYDLSHDAFWRGPVWMAPNWFIYHGLKRYGHDDIALELKQKSLALIEQSGFREHYHPITGLGLGAPNFTWAGLVLDMC